MHVISVFDPQACDLRIMHVSWQVYYILGYNETPASRIREFKTEMLTCMPPFPFHQKRPEPRRSPTVGLPYSPSRASSYQRVHIQHLDLANYGYRLIY